MRVELVNRSVFQSVMHTSKKKVLVVTLIIFYLNLFFGRLDWKRLHNMRCASARMLMKWLWPIRKFPWKVLRYSWRVCTKVFYELLVFLRAVYISRSLWLTAREEKNKWQLQKHTNVKRNRAVSSHIFLISTTKRPSRGVIYFQNCISGLSERKNAAET